MAELITLARPYAKAAFEYARANQALTAWSESLAVVASVIQQPTVEELLDSPTITSEQKATSLLELCGDELNEKVKNFVAVMAGNKRLGLLKEVQQLFESFKSQQEKFADITISSAFKLDSTVEKALSEKLRQTLASEVSLSTNIDKALIGGVVVRAGDTVIDGSVKGRLAKLAETISL
ncbi:F0F1 ATP synthase subunit delta [Candidatus Endobugula sertula]|uniref:ATP synthase subunit delta n=1 Tax=Candidatus Endobugula sertula TaxID=62101 RepID=A0A1D2QNJ5_9GAMM|nr:F0F1 ATP synthase subunit delta [Candidatus Endobugula sertula]